MKSFDPSHRRYRIAEVKKQVKRSSLHLFRFASEVPFPQRWRLRETSRKAPEGDYDPSPFFPPRARCGRFGYPSRAKGRSAPERDFSQRKKRIGICFLRGSRRRIRRGRLRLTGGSQSDFGRSAFLQCFLRDRL